MAITTNLETFGDEFDYPVKVRITTPIVDKEIILEEAIKMATDILDMDILLSYFNNNRCVVEIKPGMTIEEAEEALEAALEDYNSRPGLTVGEWTGTFDDGDECEKVAKGGK